MTVRRDHGAVQVCLEVKYKVSVGEPRNRIAPFHWKPIYKSGQVFERAVIAHWGAVAEIARLSAVFQVFHIPANEFVHA